MTIDTGHDEARGGEPPEGAEEDGLDLVIVAVLGCLRDALSETPGRAWSLAKLSKRSQVPMSTLTELDAAGITKTELNEEGIGHVVLTGEGIGLSEALFGGQG
ncbi:MAG: ArsR family transcriptional regulator [Burkholderia gladioli]